MLKQKKKLIYEFVDEVIDHGFKANQEVVNHETIKIDMVNEDRYVPAINSFWIGAINFMILFYIFFSK